MAQPIAPQLALLEASGPLVLQPEQVYRRRGTDGLWRRFALRDGILRVTHGDGPHARREGLKQGDVLRLGRRAVPLGSLTPSRRYPEAARWHGFLARSPHSWRTLSRLAAAAASDASVWLRGESGTGKELAARALHAAGPRRDGPFVALNCAALPEALAEAELFGARRGAYTGAQHDRPGAFVQAHGGTLFLDEVGELPPGTQAKLLRVLESGDVMALGANRPRHVSVRVVSATWRDLDDDAESGCFRFDLLQRLGVLRVDLSPLRRRPADIAPLLEACLCAAEAEDLWPHERLLSAIEQAPWPGNVRQLQNAVHRASVWGESQALLPVLRPPRYRGPHGRLSPRLLRGHRARLSSAHSAIHGASGNRTAAARSLGVSRSTLYRWLAEDQPVQVLAHRPLGAESPVDTP